MNPMAAARCALLIIAVVQAMPAQSPAPSSLETELRTVLRERWAALARHDAKAYGEFLDDEVLIPDNGLVYDKKALIERAQGMRDSGGEPREVRVHGDGNTAVMVYRTTGHVPYAGVEIQEESRIVETYVKRNGRWLLTARGEGNIPNANRVPAKVDGKVLDDYVGEYLTAPNHTVKISHDGDHLVEQVSDDPEPGMDLPLSRDSFFQREQPGVLTFTRSPDGKVDSYVLWIYDTTIVGKKVK